MDASLGEKKLAESCGVVWEEEQRRERGAKSDTISI